MRSLAGIRKIIQSLQTPTVRAIGVAIDVRTGRPRKILTSDGVQHPAPENLTVAELPKGCRVIEYDPSREAVLLYRSDRDGRCHTQRVCAVNEDMICGRAPSWSAPIDQWPALFAKGEQAC
jgi:hypothetical protein